MTLLLQLITDLRMALVHRYSYVSVIKGKALWLQITSLGVWILGTIHLYDGEIVLLIYVRGRKSILSRKRLNNQVVLTMYR